MARALLLDLDGVLREWPTGGADPDAVGGLSAETIRTTLFDPELLQRAVLGAISDEQWQLEAAARLKAMYGVDCASVLLDARAFPGLLRADVLDICSRARQRVPVCLITNATSRLDDHLRQLELTSEFDRVFNSSELGVAKPDTRIFDHACAELGLAPSDVVFVDDTEGHVQAAASVGLRAHLFTTAAELEALLVRESVLA